jgi:hypothetical protein
MNEGKTLTTSRAAACAVEAARTILKHYLKASGCFSGFERKVTVRCEREKEHQTVDSMNNNLVELLLSIRWLHRVQTRNHAD